MSLIGFIWSLVGEFLIGLFSGLAGGSLQDVFKYLSRLWKHI